jgi:predicted nuclease with TOPRIM domain
MAEPIKFTEEELKTITELRDSNTQKIGEFGQIELEFLLANQRLESLRNAKTKLQEDYVELQKTEQELVRKLNEKYGAGTVDLASGEFIPVN